MLVMWSLDARNTPRVTKLWRSKSFTSSPYSYRNWGFLCTLLILRLIFPAAPEFPNLPEFFRRTSWRAPIFGGEMCFCLGSSEISIILSLASPMQRCEILTDEWFICGLTSKFSGFSRETSVRVWAWKALETLWNASKTVLKWFVTACVTVCVDLEWFRKGRKLADFD